MKQLRGVVMCGGQSKRMGTDKGLICLKDTCWAKHMERKLTAIGLSVSIAINPSQYELYKAIFDPDMLVLDSKEIAGPLNGIFSVHTKHPGDDLLLLACDMINMRTETLKDLIRSYQTQPKYDYYTYQNKEHAEPFCAIYTGSALSALMRANLNLSGWGLQKVLNMGETMRLSIADTDSFRNYNTPLQSL